MFGYALAFAVLAYASYSDVRTREVSDLVWLAGYPAALALSLFEVSSGTLPLAALLASVGFSVCASAALLRLGLFGGADALALTFIGLAAPAYPRGLPLAEDPLRLPVFATLCNASLLGLASPITVFALNLADVLRGRNPLRGIEVDFWGALVLLFTARRVSLERIMSGLQYFPAERLVEKDGRPVRTPVYFVRAEADVSTMARHMAEHGELYSDGVLASPTLPMIAFLLAGLALTLLGNIALLIMRALPTF